MMREAGAHAGQGDRPKGALPIQAAIMRQNSLADLAARPSGGHGRRLPAADRPNARTGAGGSASGGGLLPVGLEPRVDQCDGCINDGVAQALLRRDGLHQLVRAFDVGRAVVERAGG